MSGSDKKQAPLPTKEQVLEFINDSNIPVGKREIARAFQLKGQQRAELRVLLKELEKDGTIDRGHKRRMAPKGVLPEVSIIEVTELDIDGELHAKPVATQTQAVDEAIHILLSPGKRRSAAPKVGDRVLARLRRIGEKEYEAEAIRILEKGAQKTLGLLEPARGGAILRPTDRRNNKEFFIPEGELKGAKAGQLVLASAMPGRSLGIQTASVTEIIGALSDDKAFSLIAIHAHGIPHVFSDAVIKEAEAHKAPTLGKRDDLRDIPLVTIDGADARDFDDAVFAERDDDPNNKDGWHLIVAIADVSHYVHYNSALDKSAVERGNSVYFPDRVVPMLPEALSNGLCSLRPKEDRACLAVHMWISKEGNLLRHKFVRGLMQSVARLTYEQVQSALDGFTDDVTDTLLDDVLKPLYGAYSALDQARAKRGTLELEIPERQIFLNDEGRIKDIQMRQRLDSHKLIEEFMICANVAAAEALEFKNAPAMYRVHESPSLDKLEALRESLAGMGFNLAKGAVIRPHHFTGILKQASDTDKIELISSIVLRSQSQAKYSSDNLGHFGLALDRYCHFTSPIRRYSDVLVHRSLISAYNLGDDGLTGEQASKFQEIGDEISNMERRASGAEREVVDRYTTAYLADQIGASFKARINGVTRFGLFVTLGDTGADGLVPVSTLPYDRYFHDETAHALIGDKKRLAFTLGDKVEVKLSEADIVTGSMIFEMLEGGKTFKGKIKRTAGRGGKPRSKHKNQKGRSRR